MSRRENNLKRMKASKRRRRELRKEANETSSEISQPDNMGGRNAMSNNHVTLDALTSFIQNSQRIKYIHNDNLKIQAVEERMLAKGGRRITCLSVARSKVEEGCVDDLFCDLCEKLFDRETVIKRRQDVRLVFRGYENDPRPLWGIPEVRSFIRKIDLRFPYMFYFASIESNFLPILLASTYSEDSCNGAYILTNIDKFFERHFYHMNEIFEKYQLSEDLLEEMSKEIFEQIKQSIRSAA